MPKASNIVGMKFGSLTVLERSGSWRGRAEWLCSCGCGNTCEVAATHLTQGRRTTCGCRSYLVKHDLSRTPEYRTWAWMKQRCYNVKASGYPYYGGRGIRICDEWLSDPEAFINYVGVKPTPRHTIDRYPNNDGHYEPGNVRWATRKEQMNNARHNILVELDGEIHNVSEWCGLLHIDRGTVLSRITTYGWAAKDAILMPVGSKGVTYKQRKEASNG